MIIHNKPHPLAGETVRACIRAADNTDRFVDFEIADWLDREIGKPWIQAAGHTATCSFAYRAGFRGLPHGNEVIIGYIAGVETVIHESELVDETTLPPCLGCKKKVETLDRAGVLCPDCEKMEREADPYKLP